jgi:protein TonB
MRTGGAPDVLGWAQAGVGSACASSCAAPPVAPPQPIRRPAPDGAREGSRRRLRLAGALAVSLVAHGALAALVWRAPPPAPAPGLIETHVEFAGEIPAAQAGAQSIAAPAASPAAPAASAPEPAPAAEAPSHHTALARLDPAPNVDPVAASEPVSAPAPAPAPRAAPALAPAPAARREPRAASAGAQQAAAAPPHYLTQVMARLQAAQRFPEQSRARGEEGRAVVRFAIRRDGALGEARLAASSGHAALDQAALEAVRRAAPFPPPPIAGGTLTLTAPMRFRIE